MTIKEAMEILGIKGDVPLGDVVRAYQVLVQVWHPEVNDSEDATVKMSAINTAYHIVAKAFERQERLPSIIPPKEEPFSTDSRNNDS